MSSARGITTLIASGAVVAGVGLAGAPAALADGPNTPPEVVAAIEAASWPVLSEGDSRWEVSVVKFMLFDFGYLDVVHADEHFDERLTAAVEDYQTDQGLTADGVVGRPTWEALAEDLGLVRRGDENNLVKAVQTALISGYGYDLLLDGRFGPATDGAVREFQGVRGIDADGVVGPITFQALMTPDDVSVDD
ncbi:peptidoglycan-binding domain-containing protein [Nocardiopsis metallicus]|uniref:Peptidoglycan hydrolase-like protein with peptidoglycan-binding domain n=1 Tax=Nocardiopsis metallicus TaxID=179819 RepID=A0A840WGK4_9ACTN|nr:peptidoglycan-binding protein [Nocardiopsis metallicus]MBB5494583.1 peptidoglycan hydrolase-like protein with peptidoglycan-binding domain [Nocardiopsis metallicus]